MNNNEWATGRSTRFVRFGSRLLGVFVVGGFCAASDMQGPVETSCVATATASGGFSPEVVAAIRQQTPNDRAFSAAQLLASKNPLMRAEALKILTELPAPIAADTVRKALTDPIPANRIRAALYLAKEANDGPARAVLLTSALDKDPATATTAVEALGWLGGPDVGRTLLSVLQNPSTPRPVFLAAITTANSARARECTPVLAGFLNQIEPAQRFSGDTARVCDMAAAALENIYRINYVGKPGSYFAESVAKRDEGIAVWRKWAATTNNGTAGLREQYVSQLIEKVVTSLRDTEEKADIPSLKDQLSTALGTRFCLGDLSGVDAVVGPALEDQWRIMRVAGEDLWVDHVNVWQRLETAFIRNFLIEQNSLREKPTDCQALAFVLFAEREPYFPRVLVWSLCRNFADVFPRSGLLPDIVQVCRGLEDEFARNNRKIVLHGHTPVLEPVPSSGKPQGNMVPVGYSALHQSLEREPSNWLLHRVAVQALKTTGWNLDAYPLLSQQTKLYPGNEWSYIANAAYLLRVRKEPDKAMVFAEKALILNPDNAKAYVVRGAIRLATTTGTETAAADLAQAMKIDPDSLGGEPETSQAVLCLIEWILRTNGKPAAQEALRRLGGLTVFNATQPLRDMPEFQALAQRAM